MKKKLIIGLVIGLLTLTMVLTALPVGAVDPPGLKKVPFELQPKDGKLLEFLAEKGVDKNYVQLDKDYGSRLEGKSPYSITYKDLKSNNYYMLVSGLPHSDAFGVKLDSTWYEYEGKFYSGYNLFWAIVNDNTITVSPNFDQPNGSIEGDQVIWNPQLFIDGEEIQPRTPPILLAVDPVNPNYFNNTIEWNYGDGIKRTVRIIEGRIREWWVFSENPQGEIRIKHNISGNLPLILGQGYNANEMPLEVTITNDEEIVSVEELNKATYPIRIGASPETFYPDAHAETSSVDGYTYAYSAGTDSWEVIHDRNGDFHNDEGAQASIGLQVQGDEYKLIFRAIFVFNTTGLPDTCTITGAVLSLWGESKTDGMSITPDINIATATTASNTDLANGDHLHTGFGMASLLSTLIAYGDFSTVAYNDFTLADVDTDGFGYISKTGVTKLGAVEDTHDANDFFDDCPDISGNGWDVSRFDVYTADQGDTANDPKLVVTYITVSLPTVTTQAATDIEDTTATGNGNITNTGGENCDIRGIVWDLASQGAPGNVAPGASGYANDVAESNGFGTGAFTRSLTGLPTGDTIYCRAYAHNSAGYAYGAEVNFLTKPAAPTNVVASSNDETKVVITWTKSTGATDYHVWRGAVDLGAAGDVATFDDAGATAATITNAGTVTATDGTETAHVELSLAGEATGVTEHSYKVVASNATGDSDDSTPDNGNRSVGAITYQWQRSAGDADGGYGNVGGATTDPYNDSTAPAGIITPGTASASDGTSVAHITLSLAGESVADGAGRYFQCIVSATGASNSPQTSDNNRGYRGTGAITYAWQVSAGDSDAAYGALGGATTDPYNDATAPANGDGRWYYCEVSATGTTTQDSTHNRGWRAVAPTIITESCTGFDLLWAIINGNIEDEGTSGVTRVGFEYGLSTSYDNNWWADGEWETGDDFWTRLSPLTPATVYHYRAMAYNGDWGYGADRVFSTEGSPTLYEYLNTGGDGDSGAIYSANWTAEQFTSANISHTVTSIRVPLKRVGTYPGIVELALTYADSDNFSTGADLTSALLNGDAMSDTAYVWYDFDVSDMTLAYDTSYAVVVRATSGNATDYILWQKDTGGALADAVGSHSMDSGITWVSDSPVDYLFEIWGEVVMSVEDAQVFTGYIEEGDWLITLTYKNTFEPYYPTDDVETYFDIQLLDDTTIKAQVNCPMWGYRPASIYISKAHADTLNWGNSDYKVRLIGSFGTNPKADYSLTALDWTGGELTFLDKWIIAQANDIGEEDDVVLTVDIADKGEVLNATGHTIFSLGIHGINEVRPDLFEMVVLTPSREEEEYTHAMTGAADWEVKLGPTLSGVLTDWGAFMAMDGQTFGGVLTFVGFVAIFVVLAAMGAWAAGLVFGYVILLGGAWLGLINWVLLGVITFVAFIIFVWQRVLTR